MRRGSQHIYFCKKLGNLELSKGEIKLQFLKYNFPEITNKKVLEKEYIVDIKSLPDIRKKYGIDYKAILFLLDFYGIQKRSMSKSQTLISWPKAKKTNLERYGVEGTLSKGTKFYKEKNKTIKEKYGVKNIFQDKNIVKKIKEKKEFTKKFGIDNKVFRTRKGMKFWENLTDEQKNEYENLKIVLNDFYKNKNKIIFNEDIWKISIDEFRKNVSSFYKKIWEDFSDEKKSLIKKKRIKYWESLTDEEFERLCDKLKENWFNLPECERKNYLKKRFRWKMRKTSIEKKIAKALSDLSIPYESQFYLKRKFFDFRISKSKILIEVNGDFWHGNPKKYKSDDILSHPGKKIVAKEIWKKDKEKEKIAIENNFLVLVFWEDEINGKQEEEICELILEKLKEREDENNAKSIDKVNKKD